METKTLRCPKCKRTSEISGAPGQRVFPTCPYCGTVGQYTFPAAVKASHDDAIVISHLTKSFKDTLAVSDVSFAVRRGEVFGFLGPNGAGKTTTIKAMLGLIAPDSGTVRINGHDVQTDGIAARTTVSFLPERVAFYENLTPVQTLRFFCGLRQQDPAQIPGLLHDVGLEKAADRKVGTFSKGMVQLLGIAQAMIGHPSIYILDEPSSGLDPRWVKVIRDKITQLNEAGATVIFSSHILSEVESLCDRVAIIDKGRLVAQDTVDNLGKVVAAQPRLEATIPGLNGKTPGALASLPGVTVVSAKGDVLTVTCDPSLRSKVVRVLEEAGYAIKDIRTIETSLEDVFMRLTGAGV